MTMSEDLAILSIKNQMAGYRLEIEILKQKLKVAEGKIEIYENEIMRLKGALERKGE